MGPSWSSGRAEILKDILPSSPSSSRFRFFEAEGPIIWKRDPGNRRVFLWSCHPRPHSYTTSVYSLSFPSPTKLFSLYFSLSISLCFSAELRPVAMCFAATGPINSLCFLCLGRRSRSRCLFRHTHSLPETTALVYSTKLSRRIQCPLMIPTLP